MQTSVQLLCHHCGNEVISEPIFKTIEDREEVFCCTGCLTVSEIIHSSGKEHYYNLRGSTAVDRVSQDFGLKTNLDTPEIYKKYLNYLSPLDAEIFVKITNIHCSACVWLNEKALEETEGVTRALINFATGTARVQFNPAVIGITQIFEIIRAIGYNPMLFKPGEKLQKGKNNLRSLLIKIGVAAFSTGNIMLFSVALYSGYFSGMELVYKRLLHFVSWALATPAYLYSGSPFMKGAFSALRRKTLTMDLLLFFGISLAYFYSVYVTLTDIGEVYFDSVCMIYFFILIGKYFEEKSRVYSHEKMDELLCKLPEMSTVLQNDTESSIPSEKIQKGMVLKILAGERLPVDIRLLSEKVNLDESFLTGESKPVLHKKNTILHAGSICLDTVLYGEAYSDYAESSLSRMKNRIEDAILSKPKIQVLTERIASVFIRTVFFIAISTFFGWLFVSHDFEKALVYTISVLIVACPCALGISVPTALVTNHIVNSRFGAILKSPNAIDPLSRLDTILFDKTGTLTEGKFKVVHSTLPEEFHSILYRVEKESRHPIARSIQNFLENKNPEFSKMNWQFPDTFQILPGEGMRAEFLDYPGVFLIGNSQLLEKNSILTPKVSMQGTLVHIARNNKYLGHIVLSDTLRQESPELIQKLKTIIPDIRILSGDREESVRMISEVLGISSYRAECKPETKAAIVKQLHSEKKFVAMVGDGINDSLSLAGADVGISHSAAEDLSIDKSDLIIVSGNLLSIHKAILSAKITEKVIRQNILISLFYNSLMLPLAVFGFMLPVICAGFMTLSSLTVLINSLSIRWRTKT